MKKGKKTAQNKGDKLIFQEIRTYLTPEEYEQDMLFCFVWDICLLATSTIIATLSKQYWIFVILFFGKLPNRLRQ